MNRNDRFALPKVKIEDIKVGDVIYYQFEHNESVRAKVTKIIDKENIKVRVIGPWESTDYSLFSLLSRRVVIPLSNVLFIA